jgi:glycosyltransferase involved in cell wall biosynthesis
MRIAFDFDAVSTNRFAGLYTYAKGLLRGFSKLAERPESVLVCSRRFSRDIRMFEDDYSGWVTVRPLTVKRRWLEKLWRHIRYPSLQQLIGDFDIYHCLYNLMPPTAGRPRILTVHDLRRYKLPELYERSKLWRFELAVERADHFMAVSQSTKNDLCQIFGIPQDKVDVIHLAADERLSPLSQNDKNRLKAKFSEQMKTSLDRFVIAISASDMRKNIERTVRAFRVVARQLPKGTKLVVAGTPPRDFGKPEREKAYLYENVIWTNGVDNLYEWLGCADALVYASLYEGFGIPILKAFACGVPVITSNCSSIPEVAGDAAMLVDPYDEQSISQAIANVCNDEELQKRLIRAGLARNGQFNWTVTAEKTLSVYRKVLQPK